MHDIFWLCINRISICTFFCIFYMTTWWSSILWMLKLGWVSDMPYRQYHSYVYPSGNKKGVFLTFRGTVCGCSEITNIHFVRPCSPYRLGLPFLSERQQLEASNLVSLLCTSDLFAYRCSDSIKISIIHFMTITRKHFAGIWDRSKFVDCRTY